MAEQSPPEPLRAELAAPGPAHLGWAARAASGRSFQRELCLCRNTIREPWAGSKASRGAPGEQSRAVEGDRSSRFLQAEQSWHGKVRPKGADSGGREEKMTAKVESAKRQRGLILPYLITLLTQRFHGGDSRTQQPEPKAWSRLPPGEFLGEGSSPRDQGAQGEKGKLRSPVMVSTGALG